VGPCLWACVGAGVIAGAGTAWLVKSIMDGRVARAELREAKADQRLSEFRGDIAEAKGQVLTQQAKLQAEATATTTAAIERAVEQLTGAIASSSDRAALASLTTNITKLQEDARYACRDIQLPAWYLDGLRIPRAEAGPATGNGH
jgi:hypothetical protein